MDIMPAPKRKRSASEEAGTTPNSADHPILIGFDDEAPKILNVHNSLLIFDNPC